MGEPSQLPPLYNDNDSVQILDDASFIGKNLKIKPEYFSGPGVLKVYARWCPHCKDKVKCLNHLASLLQPNDMQVYVLESDDNPIFARHYGRQIQAYPTFLEVTANGYVGERLLGQNGMPVFKLEDIVGALCNFDKTVCTYMKNVEQCMSSQNDD